MNPIIPRLFLFSSLFLLPTLASAATIRVTTTDDDVTVNGNCTLREAIAAANTDTAVDACATGTSYDTIDVPAGTYLLPLGVLEITRPLRVRGAGALRTVLDGELQTQILIISTSGSRRTVVERLGLTRGDAMFNPHARGGGGGAIYHQLGRVLLRQVAITECQGAGGGAISKDFGLRRGNLTQLRIVDSVISDNLSGGGGGIHALGYVHLQRTLVTHNTVRPDWASAGAGGGVWMGRGTLLFEEATVRDNTAPSQQFPSDDCFLGGPSPESVTVRFKGQNHLGEGCRFPPAAPDAM